MTWSIRMAPLRAAAALAFVPCASHAASFSHGAEAVIETNATLNLVEQAHRIHRAWARGWVSLCAGIAMWGRAMCLSAVESSEQHSVRSSDPNSSQKVSAKANSFESY
jgi:hypothetical protein